MQFSKENLIKFVDKFLDLNEDSLKFFAERVINPDIAKEYVQLELDENHRKYWELENEELLEKTDEGWFYFCNSFRRFKDFYNISYKDFKKNKVKVEKNYVKIQKKLFDFLLESKIDSVEMSGVKREINLIFDASPPEEIRCDAFSQTSGQFDFIFRECKEEGNISREAVLAKHAFYLKEEIKKHFEIIGARKLSDKKKLYLVFTKNPIDMLFCSTGKSWGSCLSFASSYTYWTGLPNAVINKNRGMFYITDKEQTPVFSDGILSNEFPGTIDKVLARSWSLIIKDYLDRDVISLVKFYPNSSYFPLVIDYLNKNVKTENEFVREAEGYSKYYLDLLYNSVGASPFIYLDSGEVKSKKGKWKLLTGQDCGSCFVHDNGKLITQASFYRGLPDGIFTLVKDNIGIQEGAGRYKICPYCGYLFEASSDHFDDEEKEICSDCYIELFRRCNICGEIKRKEDIEKLGNFGYICQSCAPHIKPCSVCEKMMFVVDKDETTPVCSLCQRVLAC